MSSISDGFGLPCCGLGWNWIVGTGPGQKPPRNANKVTSTGFLRRWDINPWVFGRVKTALRYDFTVPSTVAQLCRQLSIWVLIVSWPNQFANCAVLCGHSSSAPGFVIRPIMVELLWNKAKFQAKLVGFRSRPNEYWSDRTFQSGR